MQSLAEVPACRAVSIGPTRRFHRLVSGRHDYVLTPQVDKNIEQLEQGVIDICDLLDISRQLHDSFLKRGAEHSETDVEDITSVLSIPFPRVREAGNDLLLNDVGPAHIPLGSALERIRRRLFDSEIGDYGEHSGRLSIRELRKAVRIIRVPTRIRHVLIYLYQNFANYVADPQLVDCVIDLYDVFATLHKVLVKISQELDEDALPSADAFFDERETNALVQILAALDNALAHRVTANRPQLEVADMAADFRGGLNQFVSAADAVLKCGLALLKWRGGTRGKDPRKWIMRRENCGGVAKLTFHPHTRCRRIGLGEDDYDYCLASIDMNFGHIFRPEEFVNYFHETAHLVYDVIDGLSSANIEGIRNSDSSDGSGTLASARVFTVRNQEVYAGLYTLLFVFQGDVKLYLTHHLCGFSAHPISVAREDFEAIHRITETLIRAFLVTDPFASQEDPESPWSQPGKSKADGINSAQINAALERFMQLLDSYGPICWQFSRLMRDYKHAFRSFAEKLLPLILEPNFLMVDSEWRRVHAAYEAALSVAFGDGEERDASRTQLTTRISDAVDQGRPYLQRPYYDYTDDESKLFRLDDVFITAEFLRVYVERCYEQCDVPDAFHVQRTRDGRVDLSIGQDTDAKFFFDRVFGGLFAVDPAARRQRLRWQIAVLKNLWDLSTNVRARRLTEVIDDNWNFDDRGSGASDSRPTP